MANITFQATRNAAARATRGSSSFLPAVCRFHGRGICAICVEAHSRLHGRDEGDVPGPVARIRFHAWAGACVHGKVTIIDDIWCAVGSANCMRRSFHTDLELSVGIVTAQIGFTRFEAIMPDIGGTRSP